MFSALTQKESMELVKALGSALDHIARTDPKATKPRITEMYSEISNVRADVNDHGIYLWRHGIRQLPDA